MGVWGLRLAIVAAACVLLYFVPLVRVTRIVEVDSEGFFNATDFAETFWTERLIPATTEATSATQVVAALSKDAEEAGEQHGRRVGVSRGFLLFVQGAGKVDSVGEYGMTLKVDGGGEIALSTRKVFGATIRDATGLLKGDEAPSSREYNAIANELNRLATQQAIAKLENAVVGDRLRFAGCAKVVSATGYKPPLEIIPVLVEAAE